MSKKNIIICALVELLVVCFALNLTLKINDKKTVSYVINPIWTLQETIMNGESYKFLLEPVGAEFDKLTFGIQACDVDRGLQYNVCNKDGVCVYESSTIISAGVTTAEIPLGGAVFNVSEQYTVTLQNVAPQELQINTDEDGNIVYTQVYKFTNKVKFVILIWMVTLVTMITLLVVMKSDRSKAVWVGIIVMSILLTIVIPPYSAPDELRHFARAYDIAQGNIICEKTVEGADYAGQTLQACDLPIELFDVKLISESNGISFYNETNSKINFDVFISQFSRKFSGETIDVPILGTAGLNPLAYLPQIIFILLARLLHMRPIMYIYMARWGNALAALLIAYVGYKVIPKCKTLYLATLFIPGIAYLRCTNSTDGLLYSLVLFVFAYILFVKESQKKLYTLKNMIMLYIPLAWISIIKLPYILVALYVLILNDEQVALIKKIGKGWANKLITCGILLAPLMIIYKLSTIFVSLYQVKVEESSASVLSVSVSSLIQLLMRPNEWVNTILNPILWDTTNYLSAGISCPNNNMIVIPTVCWLIYVMNSQEIAFDKKTRGIFVSISIITWFVIIGVFYIVGLGMGINAVYGLQGRYILPLLPAFLMGFTKQSEDVVEINTVTLIGCVFMYIHLLIVFATYWL